MATLGFNRRSPAMSPRSASPLLALGIVAAVFSCRTAGEHRADADREVYEILVQRRQELGAQDLFTIDIGFY